MWDGTDKKTKESEISTQKVYLQNAKDAKTFLILLDELRAYTLGLDFKIKILEKIGKKAIYDKGNERESHTTLIAVYDLVNRYYEMKLSQPNFQKSKLRIWIEESLAKAREVIEKWEKSEVANGIQNKILKREKDFFDLIVKR